MVNKNFLDVLFWISLIVGILMVLWRVFGDSPTDLQVIAPFIVMGFAKVWNVNERQIRLEMGTKGGFGKMKYDFGLIKQDIGLIKERLEI